MQTYLELKVPIKTDSKWLIDLKQSLSGVPVRWQNGFYHITVAFVKETTAIQDVVSVIDRHINEWTEPGLVFDKVDTFTANVAGFHIVNLTSSKIPESFSKWTDELRCNLKGLGCVIDSDFRLHVTLGRVDAKAISLEGLQERMENVRIKPMSLALHSFEYRKFRGETINKWNQHS